MTTTKLQRKNRQNGFLSIIALLIIGLLLNLPAASIPVVAAENELPLTVDLPDAIAGNEININGATEAGARVTLSVNEQVKASALANSAGVFLFPTVILERNQVNTIVLTAVNSAGNTVRMETQIVSDSIAPVITLNAVPEFVTENFIQLIGTVSELSTIEIVLHNTSLSKEEGTQIDQHVNLQEGQNAITIIATDKVGLIATEEISIESDTRAPTVEAEIEKGREYYEGRAESSIHGTTKPGATAFLYVYKPLGYEYKPDFKTARAVVKADDNGKFTFVDVDFASLITDTLAENLVPRQVPSGLESASLSPSPAQEQSSTYYVYIIVEDRTGRTAYWQSQVTVNSCFSANLDFAVESIPKFQFPLRLNPTLLDSGRQEVQAVFQLTYQGQGVPAATAASIEEEKGFRILDVRIDEACTQGMLKDKESALACKILPKTRKKISSPDNANIYITWNLLRADELSKKSSNYWDEFKKRRVVFPLKLTINYQEREGPNKFGNPKVQSSCVDLGYQIDIPVESKEFIPDFLANEGVDALNTTITQLQTIRPYVEKAYIFAGIGCMSSFALRTVARFARIFTAQVEGYYGEIKAVAAAVTDADKEAAKKEKCPVDQNGLYLESTLENWYDILEKDPSKKTEFPETIVAAFEKDGSSKVVGENGKLLTLEKLCPSTASAWKFEQALDTAYKWTCDRAFCRAVPAGWTATESENKIGSVILSQQQCAVTGRGIPLLKRENCQNLVKTNIINAPQAIDVKNTNVCWQTAEGNLYYYVEPTDLKEKADTHYGVFRLTPVGNVLGDVAISRDRLIFYKPQGADTYVTGREQSCDQICKNPPGYVSDGCYTKKNDKNGDVVLLDKESKPLKAGYYSAGYTDECFIKGYKTGNIEYQPNGVEPIFQQCVCKGEKSDLTKFPGKTALAADKEKDITEDWFYQQDRVFQESHAIAGRYYPPTRYYAGRDVSGAFGADYLLDYLSPEGKKKVHEVNPHSQLIGTFQTLCLSGILKNMKMLEDILTGLRNCLVEAKYSGLQDAGMCKTLFTQHVCGLIYKGIAYLNNQCSPLNIDDVGKGGEFDDVGAIVSRGFKAIPETLQSSIEDVRKDYGNARLNQYFEGGAQGFAQSMCLAAFGYEFPLFSEEFLLDAAYSFPTKTSVVMAPKERELSMFNPARQTAIHNYNIGGLILAGCKIRNWKVSLKCIGPEDYGHPGVDATCGGKGCDCINAQTASSAFEGEKTKLLKSGFNLPSGQMFSIPLESPQKVDSHYRYDHVVVELVLDPSEKGNVDSCFDEGYRTSNGGIFYEPIIDVSPPGVVSCSANLVSGQYVCPELSSLFGFGGAYLEEPYVTCWNERSQQWVDCKSQNLFLLGDEIKTRVHVNMDEKGKCLLRRVNGVTGIDPEVGPRPLPINAPGPLTVPDNLGTLTEQMFGGSINRIQNVPPSNTECGQPSYDGPIPEKVTGNNVYTFSYEAGTTGDTVKLIVQSGITIDLTKSPGYSIITSSAKNYLAQGTVQEFSVTDINRVVFNIDGFLVHNILGNVKAADSQKICSYQVIGEIPNALNNNARDITVTYELLERDESGTCSSTEAVKAPRGLASRYPQQIHLQRTEVVLQEVGGLHSSFTSGNYDQVFILADQVITQQRGDLSNALAIYYNVAGRIKQGEKEKKDIHLYDVQIKNLLTLFFTRQLNGQTSAAYEPSVESSPDFQKIQAYLCVIDQEFGAVYQNNAKCAGVIS